MTRSRLFVLTLAVLAFLAIPAMAENFESDPAHSGVEFRIKHFDISYVFGHFNDFKFKFSLDKANPAGNSFEFAAKVNSIDTGNTQRDKHLKSPDFFNAAEFPEITFKSTGVMADNGGYAVNGNLTLHGVTKPLSIRVEQTGEGPVNGKGHHVGLFAEFDIKRSDYGMDKMIPGAADAVHLMVSVDGAGQ